MALASKARAKAARKPRAKPTKAVTGKTTSPRSKTSKAKARKTKVKTSKTVLKVHRRKGATTRAADARRDIQKEAVLMSLESGATNRDAAEAAGTTDCTVWRWRNTDKKFAKRFLAVTEVRTEVVEGALYKVAVGGNVTAMIFWLSNRAPERWQHISRISHSGEIDSAKSFRDIAKLAVTASAIRDANKARASEGKAAAKAGNDVGRASG